VAAATQLSAFTASQTSCTVMLLLLQSHDGNRMVSIKYISSYIGVTGNEKAYQTAKSALN